jgi:threonylcarbamoyladenosine tRNA methylthiotransferase CDKAL1
MKVFIETYGCSASLNKSETISGILRCGGYALASRLEESDAVVMNTCVVKRQTEQKILDRIKSVRKNFPDKKVVLAGCLPKIPELLKKAEYDGIISKPENAAVALAEIFGEKLESANHETNSIHKSPTHNGKIRSNPLVDIEEIAEGCLGSCSYCIVRRAKGALKSESAEKIAAGIRTALKEGCKEVWLTAQDTACYGFDAGTNLPKLIASVCRIDSNFSIRVGMMNPEHALKILPQLIESYRNKKVYKFLHLPVQSGSDNILEKMSRRYKAEDFLHIISEFRKAFPMIQLWTDIIVGFPGETEEDFEKTIELMKGAKPDFANVSQFGSRPGTPAEKMEQAPGEIKKSRSKKLSEIMKHIYLENNKKWIGWKGKVLVTEKSKTGFLGKNFAYKPVQIKSDNNILGKYLNVKIIKATNSALFGEIIE